MADQFVQVNSGTGPKIDVSEITVGANVVERQRFNVSDAVDGAAHAGVVTKGTQPTHALAIQRLQDSGRIVSNLWMQTPILSTANDTLMSLTGYKNRAAVGATTTPAVVAAGEFLRIHLIYVVYVAVAAAGSVRFTLRANNTGTVAIGSPAVMAWNIGGPANAAGVVHQMAIPFPEGIDFAAGTGIGVSMQGLNATQGNAAAGYGQIMLNGYEY